jgi:iron complex transport system substrate-binding protein
MLSLADFLLTIPRLRSRRAHSFARFVRDGCFGFAMTLLAIGPLRPRSATAAPVLVDDTATTAPIPAPNIDQRRVVILGGAITEIVFALGAGDWVVGVDASSEYPAATETITKLNYHRQVSAEAVLSLRPTEVLLTSESGPEAAIEQLRKAGVALTAFSSDHTFDGAQEQIRNVAATLGLRERGERLLADLQRDIAALVALREPLRSRPRVLFLYSRGAGSLMAGGRGVAADAMIALAGGENVAAAFQGYRPLNAEEMVVAAPDVILMMDDGLKAAGGESAILEAPGVRLTPAGKSGRIVSMDGLYLLGFGPRCARAAADLARAIHPELIANSQESPHEVHVD